ncbi:MAG: hypothetical protein ACRC8Z_03320 [Empedobacter falsenii]
MKKLIFFLIFFPFIYLNAQQVFNENVGIKATTPKAALDIQNQILIDYNAPGSGIKILSASSGGWARGYYFGPKNDLDIRFGGYGAVGNLNSLNYLFIGNAYSTPTIKIFPESKLTTFHGNVGIGTNNPDAKLAVKGNIHAQEVKVDLAVPADYVFQKYYTGKSSLNSTYQFKSLEEIKSYTEQNHHLPDLPSAKEIQENGLKLGEMNNLLLQKIEELTLYLIEQNEKISKQDEKIDQLTKEINQLKQQIR